MATAIAQFARSLRQGDVTAIYVQAQRVAPKCTSQRCVISSVNNAGIGVRSAAIRRIGLATVSQIVAGVHKRCPKCFADRFQVKILAKQAFLHSIKTAERKGERFALRDAPAAAAAVVNETARALPATSAGTERLRNLVVRACGNGCKGPEPEAAKHVRQIARAWFARRNQKKTLSASREGSGGGGGLPSRDAANLNGNGTITLREVEQRRDPLHVTEKRSFVESEWVGSPCQIEHSLFVLQEQMPHAFVASHLQRMPTTHAAWMPTGLGSVRTRPGMCESMREAATAGRTTGVVLTFESGEGEFHANGLLLVGKTCFRYEPRGWNRKTYDWKRMDESIRRWSRTCLGATAFYGPRQFQDAQAEQTLDVIEAAQDPSQLPQYGPCAAWCVLFFLLVGQEAQTPGGQRDPKEAAKRAAALITRSDTDKTTVVTAFAHVLMHAVRDWRRGQGIPEELDDEDP